MCQVEGDYRAIPPDAQDRVWPAIPRVFFASSDRATAGIMRIAVIIIAKNEAAAIKDFRTDAERYSNDKTKWICDHRPAGASSMDLI